MAVTRRKLKLLPHEIRLLLEIYVEFNIPSDQYPQRPDDLADFIGTWNNLSERNDAADDVLHFILNQRKQKQWVKLGRATCSKLRVEPLNLSEAEFQVMDTIYEDMQIASDNFALDMRVAEEFQKEFARRTKKVVPAMRLAAEVIRRRKAGILATLRPAQPNDGVPFSDIAQVAE